MSSTRKACGKKKMVVGSSGRYRSAAYCVTSTQNLPPFLWVCVLGDHRRSLFFVASSSFLAFLLFLPLGNRPREMFFLPSSYSQRRHIDRLINKFRNWCSSSSQPHAFIASLYCCYIALFPYRHQMDGLLLLRGLLWQSVPPQSQHREEKRYL